MIRVLVLAHGDGRRWDNYLGAPKHFVTIDGETLLARAVRLFRERGCEVIVVGPDERYQVEGARLEHLAGINACGSDMGKLLDSRHLWSTEDRTVLVWGDVWYSDACVDSIVDFDGDDYHVWRRPGWSKTTGHRWDESWAVNLSPRCHGRAVEVAETVAMLVRNGTIPSSHIRTHLAVWNDVPPLWIDNVKHTATLPHQTHVDDWTDDFDTPAEWRSWMGRRFAGAHRVGVCVPWLAGERWREASHEWTTDHWNGLGVDVFDGEDLTGGEWPNRSAMRNDAARRALAAGCEVLVFADADTWVPADQLWAAAHLAVEREQAVLAYDVYYRCKDRSTRRFMRRGATVNRKYVESATIGARSTMRHASGVMAIPTSLWLRLGGFDERFTRWAFEDRAFWLACRTVGGDVLRVDGPAVHWWHPRAADVVSPEKHRKLDDYPADYVAGAELALRYYRAAGWMPESGHVHRLIDAGAIPPPVVPDTPDLQAMRAILAEPGAPLAALQAA